MIRPWLPWQYIVIMILSGAVILLSGRWLASKSEAQTMGAMEKIAPPIAPAVWEPTGLYRFEDPIRQVTIYLYRDFRGVAMYGFRWDGTSLQSAP